MTVHEFQKRRFSEVPQRSSARYTLSNTEKDPASFGQQRGLVYAGVNKREGIKIKKRCNRSTNEVQKALWNFKFLAKRRSALVPITRSVIVRVLVLPVYFYKSWVYNILSSLGNQRHIYVMSMCGCMESKLNHPGS